MRRVFSSLIQTLQSTSRDAGLWWAILRIYDFADRMRLGKILRAFRVVAHTTYGDLIYRPLLINDLMMAMEIYEPFVRAAFKPERGSVVFDIGSYIGFWTLFASSRVGQDGRVVSIEPNPESFDILKRNVERNHLKNVILINSAVSGKIGVANLYISSHDPAASTIVEAMSRSYNRCQRHRVSVTTVDTIAEVLKLKVDWIKMDVEGAEEEVLQGCVVTLSRDRPRIIIETSNPVVIQLLTRLDYSVEPLGGRNTGYFYCFPNAKSEKRISQL